MISLGQGVTVHYGSDCYPYTVIGITKSGKTITIQSDNYKRIDKNGYGGMQEYKYERDPNGCVLKVRKNSREVWKVLGGGNTVTFGGRRAYSDPHF